MVVFSYHYSHIDLSEALKLPGVMDVITAKDIPGKKFRTFTGYEEELLAQDEVCDLFTFIFMLGFSVQYEF